MAGTSRAERAIVLGGGGVTGIAWEAGVLVGLTDAGVDVARADAVIGTSAGAFAGVALASGDIERLLVASGPEPETEMSDALNAAWEQALIDSDGDPDRLGRAMGAIALADPEPVDPAVRRAVVRARLAGAAWPAALRVTAVDAHTGELVVYDAGSGVSLEDAVTASGAVPGVWPLADVGGRAMIDGGMRSTSNVRLAEGFEHVLVLAPIADDRGPFPGARTEAAAIGATLIEPDAPAREAIGPNLFDADRYAAIAAAGRAQGAREAARVNW